MMASVVDYIRLTHFGKMPDGVSVGVASCNDFDHYTTLPEVVEFMGMLLGKTGWNSDCGVAYYKSDATIAKVVERKKHGR